MTRKRWFWIIFIVLLLVVLVRAWNQRFGEAEDFDYMESQYKYGSIGSDHPLAQAPIPYWLWKVLPDLFDPATVVPKGHQPNNGKKGFEAFGLVTEPRSTAELLPKNLEGGKPLFERPIGFSRRRVLGMDFVGSNCAFCHQGSLRFAADGPQTVILGGTGQSVDIEKYFLYLFSAFNDPRFTGDVVMPAIERELKRQGAEMPWWQKLVYRYVLIPVIPKYLQGMETDKFDFILPNNPKRLSEFGPGRVDTWGLYKRTFIDPPHHDSISGIADFTSLWNQKAREGFRMHWDGNTDVLVERNVISALSLIGKRIEYLDFTRLTRVTDWIVGLVPPRYADTMPATAMPAGKPVLDAAQVERGAKLFADGCGQCHSPGGDRLGRVEPLEGLGTDGERIKEFIPKLADSLNKLGTDQWQLRNFKVQNGYVNNLMDGIWLRGPYLHNGSVPTLRDLLDAPEKRPKVFCRGSDVFDPVKVGWLHATVPDAQGKPSCPTSFLYDTSKPGNSNKGHLWGVDLPDADKNALVEFMKTL